MTKKIAHTLMLVAASILVLVGVPSIKLPGVDVGVSNIGVGQVAYAHNDPSWYHNDYCATEIFSESDRGKMLSHMINHHCGFWQKLGLFVALGSAAALALALVVAAIGPTGGASALAIWFAKVVALAGHGATKAGLAAATVIGIAIGLAGLICGQTHNSKKEQCDVDAGLNPP